jgi:hypothetical protein
MATAFEEGPTEREEIADGADRRGSRGRPGGRLHEHIGSPGAPGGGVWEVADGRSAWRTERWLGFQTPGVSRTPTQTSRRSGGLQSDQGGGDMRSLR